MDETWFCEACGETRDGVPFAVRLACPWCWTDEAALHPQSELLEAQCVVGGERFFFHGLVVVPVTDADRDFEWVIWVEVAEQDFLARCARWFTHGRENDPPIPAELAVALPGYADSTIGIRGHLQDRAVGLRPIFSLADAGHALARDQQLGITAARAIEHAHASH